MLKSPRSKNPVKGDPKPSNTADTSAKKPRSKSKAPARKTDKAVTPLEVCIIEDEPDKEEPAKS